MVDGGGRPAFPGVVDAHQQWGIYNPLSDDTRSESRACARGGVTTALTYMRTGQHYLNKGGDYADFFPEVLEAAAGNAHVDYAFTWRPCPAGTSRRPPSWWSGSASPRSRSSCSTAATGCTAGPRASGRSS
ncbi:hypothetical protein [Sinosporangium siamense]|uniref:Uncharacterized protein n=1 Tax=Sinosporangium siamense TaxID=1367973 RepID=A0A919RPG3_9ACTN|nr:hypothetical protein [Sinosporangium siamense]GII97506.1 hypothetical protein Ssi02_77370 [Sinosporangium siamense]